MRNWFRISLIGLIALGFGALSVPATHASSVIHQNLPDLIDLAELILVGDITAVSDGIDANGVPYTEVTLDVEDAIRGGALGPYTFRQFGLLQPRDMGDGSVNLNVIPDGWATYALGEKVMLFLYQAASQTGLRTTVGLFQGKFVIEDGMIENKADNLGLFHEMKVDPGLLSPAQTKLLDHGHGAVDANAFIGLVRNAVRNRWVEEGRMIHEN